NFNFNINNLYVKKIFVNQGVRMKRLLPRAKGRSNQIQKNTSQPLSFKWLLNLMNAMKVPIWLVWRPSV
ncbi:MAG: uL22 family ribosomal protein, partial [Candidatus Phytoplasma australasiaticum]|nr:uL22 family ribosomal protein [Candidatus Phytoplasma australasiaticum]